MKNTLYFYNVQLDTEDDYHYFLLVTHMTSKFCYIHNTLVNHLLICEYYTYMLYTVTST